jgi:hypothetical protein
MSKVKEPGETDAIFDPQLIQVIIGTFGNYIQRTPQPTTQSSKEINPIKKLEETQTRRVQSGSKWARFGPKNIPQTCPASILGQGGAGKNLQKAAQTRPDH